VEVKITSGTAKTVDVLHVRENALHACVEEGMSWFAVQVRARYESLAANSLAHQGYERFLPTYRCRRRWSDRIKELELPLFPGYIFCRFDPQCRLPILKTPGFVSIVGIAKQPVPIDESELAAIRTLVSSGLSHQPWPYARIGQRVCIECGPLAGLEGILQNIKGRQRIVVSVSLLQRSVAVEIDSTWVAPIYPDFSSSNQKEVAGPS
jgi:transcription antitermination factor NusG